MREGLFLFSFRNVTCYLSGFEDHSECEPSTPVQQVSTQLHLPVRYSDSVSVSVCSSSQSSQREEVEQRVFVVDQASLKLIRMNMEDLCNWSH